MTMQETSRPVIVFLAIMVLFSSALCGIGSAKTITATIGDTIPLNGTVQLVDTVYLFATGPGMPPNGARMDNSNAAVVTGNPDTFTQIMVENERWAYNWNTGRVSGGLAPGSHIVYVSTQPVAANALSGVNYAEIQVLLTRAVTTGTLDVASDPEDAGIFLNGKYSGDSPRVFENLAPGEYVVRLEKQGYVSEQGAITLAAGDRISFTRTLSPSVTPGTTPIPTTTQTLPGDETLVPSSTTAPLNILYLIGILIMVGILFRNPV